MRRTPVIQPSTTFGTDQSGAPQLAIDGGGTVTLVWFDYALASCGGSCIMYDEGHRVLDHAPHGLGRLAVAGDALATRT